MRSKHFLFFLFVLFISCNKNNNETKIDYPLKESKKNRNQVIENIKQELNVELVWDTVDYRFTISHDNIKNRKNQLIDYYYINDIYEKNNKYFLFICMSGVRVYYFNIEINKSQLECILSNYDNSGYEISESLLIVNINHIKKLDLSFNNYSSEDELLFYIETQDCFYGIGKLVQYVIY